LRNELYEKLFNWIEPEEDICGLAKMGYQIAISDKFKLMGEKIPEQEIDVSEYLRKIERLLKLVDIMVNSWKNLDDLSEEELSVFITDMQVRNFLRQRTLQTEYDDYETLWKMFGDKEYSDRMKSVENIKYLMSIELD